MRRDTHAGKAESYDLGRPAYPAEFFDYLYGEFGLRPDAVIADIGAGPGKAAQGFAQRGSRVYAVEPDKDMRRIALERLSAYPKCTVLGSCAEDTGIPAGTIDLIFCGNAFYWFKRTLVVPEFKRILKGSNSAKIVLAWQGERERSTALAEELKRYEKPMDRRHDESPPFCEGAFETKAFEFVLHQDLSMFLHGILSASFRPGPQDEFYEECCQVIREHFERYSKDGKLETRFKLSCMIGNVEGLLYG